MKFSQLLFVILCISISAQAQQPVPTGPTTIANDDKVFLMHSDSIRFLMMPDGSENRRVVGNVVFRHKGTMMYCNLAVQNVLSNALEAYGNVRMVQGDSITTTGDTLLYYGNTRTAKVSGRTVTLKDKKRTLTTNQLDYDMISGVAYYPNRGKTVDDENTLTSQQGYYNTQTKAYTYYKNVKLINKKYTLTTDTLFYNSLTKIADFQSPTKVVSKDGNTVVARKGSYNTETGESIFKTRTTIDNPDYTLTGDALTFDNLTKKGSAQGNVELVSKSEKTILNGDYGKYDGKAGFSKVWGHALTRSISKNDTLFMTADTLYSIEIQADSLKKDSTDTKKKIKTTTKDDDKQKPKKLIGRKNVLIYRHDLQAKCDSVIYNTLDSTITFLKKPIIWANKYQLEADTIVAKTVQNKLRTMYLKVKSFVIAQDSLANFNQIKGRQITAYFDDSTRLNKVYVEGNGESIYFVLNEKLKNMGMNRVESSKMTLLFQKNQVKKIKFIGQPDGKLMPPKKIVIDQKQLDGFNWRTKEKPTKAAVVGKVQKSD
jgi:lipopolysaccharide assembly outer membrane protein LptD (OstA)